MNPKTPAEIESMRRGGKILAQTLRQLTGAVKPGVTTAELSELAAEILKKAGAEPAFLGYQGFPAPLCVSINQQIVHGIPGSAKLAEGDIVGLDLGVIFEGLITDGAVTVPVGELAPESQKLLDGTRTALVEGLSVVKPGVKTGDIGAAIEKSLKAAGLSVVERLSGHGVGYSLHEDPEILNYGTVGTGPELSAGMTIAIEPMACLGKGEIKIEKDGWTVVTADGSRAAQFEHTVVITERGADILTQ